MCEPVFDYGRVPARVGARGRRPPRRRRQRGGADDPAEHGHGARHRGQLGPRPPPAAPRATSSTARSPGPRGSPRRPTSTTPTRGWRATTRFWRTWLSRARLPDHEWMAPIQRSALTIKGLTYMPTGATVAALTTSLPETPGGERNWDYRYTWMRDSTFTLQALHYLNLDWEADEFMQFVADLEPNEDGALQIMYGIDGRRDLTESTRDDLSGYAGARPVRDRQRRLRPAPERRVRRRAGLDPAAHAAQQAAAAPAVADRAGAGRVRDRGLARARPGHLGGARRARSTTSRRSSWAGSRWTAPRSWPTSRGEPDLASDLGARPPRRSRPTSSSTASTPAASCASTTPPTRSTRRRCSRRSSASCPRDDERLRASVLAIADELTEHGFVLRYRTGETDDGLSGKEGTFLICSFWLVSALAIIGEHQRARDLMERLLARHLAARALRRGVRRRHGPPPGQLPAGLLAPRADRGRRRGSSLAERLEELS